MEGDVELGPNGTAHINLAGRTLQLRRADGQPLGDASVLIGGKVYHVVGGKLILPASAIAEAKARGGFTLLAPGLVPTRVTLDKDAIITLPVAGKTGIARGLPVAGGALKTTDGAIGAALPAGLLKGPGDVALSSYAVPNGLGALVTVGAPIGAGTLGVSYDLTQPGNQAILDAYQHATDAQKQALEAQGVHVDGTTLTVDVKLGDNATVDGQTRVEVDTTSTLGVKLEVTVVSPVGSTLPAEATPPGFTAPSAAPSDSPGTAPSGSPTAPPEDAHQTASSTEGLLSVGEGLLITTGGLLIGSGGNTLIGSGGNTLVGNGDSTAINAGTSPLIGSGGNTLIGSGGNTLIGSGGNTLVSGANLIGSGGNTLIGSGGNTLIADNTEGALIGEIRVPFKPDLAKYKLLNYVDYKWPGAQIRPIHGLGVPYANWVSADPASMFRLAGLPNTLSGVFLQVQAGPYALYALAPAPGKREVHVDVNAATTAMSCLLLSQIASKPTAILAIDKAGYDQDVAWLQGALQQAGAGFVVSHPYDEVADFVRDLFQVNGYVAKALPNVTSLTPVIPVGPPPAVPPPLADGAAGTATFALPEGVVVGTGGKIYVCDSGHGAIRVIDTSLPPTNPGFVTTLATGFTLPRGLARDAAGNLYVTEGGLNNVWKIDPAGVKTHLAGTGVAGHADGPGGSAQFTAVRGIDVDASGNLYVAEASPYADVRKLTPGPTGGYDVSTVAGGLAQAPIDGSATAARFYEAVDVAVDRRGNLFVADYMGRSIRKIDLGQPPTSSTFVTTFAGRYAVAGDDDGLAAAATMVQPSSLCFDPAGNMYVTEVGVGYIGSRVRRLTPSGIVTTYAATKRGTFTKDGIAPDALFDYPLGSAFDPQLGLVVAQWTGHNFRQIK
jgi:hypothetical protein